MHFDTLTQELSATRTRRDMLKRLSIASFMGLGAAIGIKRGSNSAHAAGGIKAACARTGQPCGAGVTDPTRFPTVCCRGLTCNAVTFVCEDAP
jgi:hypothetical protein